MNPDNIKGTNKDAKKFHQRVHNLSFCALGTSRMNYVTKTFLSGLFLNQREISFVLCA